MTIETISLIDSDAETLSTDDEGTLSVDVKDSEACPPVSSIQTTYVIPDTANSAIASFTSLTAPVLVDNPPSKASISLSIADQLKIRNAKRKAEEQDLRTAASKRVASSSVHSSAMKYSRGALRITRTPGRRDQLNCVNLDDVVEQNLVSACIFAFFIGGDELYSHLPQVPVYIGRDPKMDPFTPEVIKRLGISKLVQADIPQVSLHLQQIYRDQHGPNFHAFYAWCTGSSHSKIMLLVYPNFLRLVITSCNMMNTDTVLGDNHWYIHDMPKLSQKITTNSTGFEADLLNHLQALNTPEVFIESIKGLYDYSSIKVHLVTSVPGVSAGIRAENHGLLRLRRIVQDLGFKPSLAANQADGRLKLEVCTGSLGNLNSEWLSNFNACVLGKSLLGNLPNVVPDMKIFYPTRADVEGCHQSAQDGASNIGCHIKSWDAAPVSIKHLFHHYASKDKGRLFHQKLILVYDAQTLPYFLYVGSANLSASAWGSLKVDGRTNANVEADRMKLIGVNNYECGIVVPRDLIMSLLEPGSQWQDIIPYNQNAPQYDSTRDRPWNSSAWSNR